MNRGDSLGKIITRVKRHGGMPRVKSKLLRRLIKMPRIVQWYFKHPDYLLNSELYYSNIEFCVTTNCTLRCEGCAHYIKMFEIEPYVAADVFIEDLKRLLSTVRYVDEFRVLGGEPLLYPELTKIVRFLLDSQHVGRVEIVTNGTIAPSKELLEMFPNDRLNIFVSNYGSLSRTIDAFASNPFINTTISDEDFIWYDHGELKYMGRNQKELAKQYKKCTKDKSIFYNGKLFACACSAFGSELKAFELRPDEFVDFRSNKKQNELEDQVKKLKCRDYFTSCNYCNLGTNALIPIKVAEQIE